MEDVEVGTVEKVRHEGIGGAFDRWKPERNGSLLDALSHITYRTREQAVRALVSG